MTHWQLNLLKQLFVHQYVRNSISVPEDMSYLISYAVDEQMELVKNLNEEDTIAKIKESPVNYDELMKQVKETYPDDYSPREELTEKEKQWGYQFWLKSNENRHKEIDEIQS